MTNEPVPMRLGVMFVHTYRFMREHLAATLGIGALLATVDATVSGVVTSAFMPNESIRTLGEVLTAQQNAAVDSDLLADVAQAVPWISLTLLVSFLTQLAATGVMTLAVVRARRDESVQPAALWRAVPWVRLLGVNAMVLTLMLLAATGPFVLALILNSFIVASIVIVIVTTIVIAIGTSLAVPAVIDEGLAVIPALRRSFELVRKRWFRVAWLLIVANLLWSLVGSIVSSPISAILGLLGGGTGSAFGQALQAITSSILTGAIALPGIAITTTLVYFARSADTDQ